MHKFVLVTVALASTSPALASGGLNCFADDEVATFNVEAGVTRGLGGPVFNFRGELQILSEAVPEGFRKSAFEHSNLAQYWLDDRELRLLIHLERDAPAGYVELEVRTQVSEESVYGGQFEVTVWDGSVGGEGTKLKGPTTCFVE